MCRLWRHLIQPSQLRTKSHVCFKTEKKNASVPSLSRTSVHPSHMHLQNPSLPHPRTNTSTGSEVQQRHSSTGNEVQQRNTSTGSAVPQRALCGGSLQGLHAMKWPRFDFNPHCVRQFPYSVQGSPLAGRVLLCSPLCPFFLGTCQEGTIMHFFRRE